VLSRLRPGRDRPAHRILCYHSHSPTSPWGVEIDAFAEQVGYLRTRFRLVALRDLPAALGEADGPVASLTFDDGTLDNYEQTLEVLERHDVKGTFFLIASLLGERLPGASGEALMSAEQARDLASRGHEVGSHTMTHADLSRLSEDRARAEIVGSRRALEDLVSAPVNAIAYPFGRHADATRAIARDAGYEMGVTTREAPVPGAPDWLALPRVSVNRSVGRMQFRAKLTPALDVYEGLRGRR
jgi:peptidoglycan/xylan/chitin deacetylase (PgdA/CDA1 family)